MLKFDVGSSILNPDVFLGVIVYSFDGWPFRFDLGSCAEAGEVQSSHRQGCQGLMRLRRGGTEESALRNLSLIGFFGVFGRYLDA
jgi:hypothetical protein